MKVNKKTVGIVALALMLGVVFGWYLSPRTFSPGEEAPVSESEAAVKFWTCSMHPQIKLPGPGKCPKCAMDLIPVMESGGDELSGLRELKLSPSALALAEVETALVERRYAKARIRLVGKVDYDETRLAYLTARVAGRLDRLFVDYTGVQVSKGDHMVYIYSPELLAAQEELIQSIRAVENLTGSDISLVTERAANNVGTSREKLRLWGLTEDQIQAIEKRGKADDHFTIYAPVSGTVIHKNALEGAYVQTGTRIYTIADLSQVWVMLDAYESDLSWLHYGQEVTFETESHPGRAFNGTIAFIDPVLNEKTRTVKVRVNVDNAAGDLKPGMFVRATVDADIATDGRVMSPDLAGKMICPMHPEIIKDEPGDCDICGMPLVTTESLGYGTAGADTQEAPLVIPATAPLITGTRAIVYVKSADRDGVFEGREIVLGPRAGDDYLVRRGLMEGERVVTKGAFKLDAELQINAMPSMMTPGGGGGGGHDHGGPSTSEGEDLEGHDGMPGMGLSSLTRSQLQALLSAARTADEATEAGDREEIRAAFTALSERVEEVTAEDIEGHYALLWKEYAMFLGNDGLEGSTAESVEEAQRVAGLLREHVASMVKTMGLSQGAGMESAPTLPPAFLAQFAGVVNAYVDAQGALAGDDFEEAKAAIKTALSALQAVDMKLLQGDDHMAWMDFARALGDTLAKLDAAKDIEAGREVFYPLSQQMMEAVRRFGAPGGPLYQFECTMAFGGKGATWIQKDKETRNPYYGAMMFGCGSVIDAIAGTETDEGHEHD